MSKTETWEANPGPQTQVLQRREKEILFGGARSGGKTEAGLAWLMEPEYIDHPQYHSLVIRRNYDDLCDWLARARRFYDGFAKIVGQPAEIRWSGGGITRIGHWNDREALGKYLGHEYHKMLVEELTDAIATEKEYLMLLGSLRSSIPELPAQFLGTTNPGNRGHAWVKRRWVIPAYKKTYIDPDTKYSRIYIPCTVDDNPKADQAYVRYLEGLPEPLRSAWRFGSWEGFEGQFFIEFGVHLAEDPFFIQPSQAQGHLIGSLDSGTTHATSFGLWYIGFEPKLRDYVIHRVLSYLGTGGTVADHANEIYNKIESCPQTGGFFPDVIYPDPSMWTKVKLNEYSVRAPIDEYIDLFRNKNKPTRFEPANNDRVNGCQLMRMVFKVSDNAPRLRYFRGYNTSFEEGISCVITDKNNVETYAKMDGDDAADEARYGVVGAYSFRATLQQKKRFETPKTYLEKLLAGQYAPKSQQPEDWVNA